MCNTNYSNSCRHNDITRRGDTLLVMSNPLSMWQGGYHSPCHIKMKPGAHCTLDSYPTHTQLSVRVYKLVMSTTPYRLATTIPPCMGIHLYLDILIGIYWFYPIVMKLCLLCFSESIIGPAYCVLNRLYLLLWDVQAGGIWSTSQGCCGDNLRATIKIVWSWPWLLWDYPGCFQVTPRQLSGHSQVTPKIFPGSLSGHSQVTPKDCPRITLESHQCQLWVW